MDIDRKQAKKLQDHYSKDELERMLQPDEELSPRERLKQVIKNKQMRRSGLNMLKHNLSSEMAKHNQPANNSVPKSRLELLIESVPVARLRRLKHLKTNVTAEKYASYLGLINQYIHTHDSVKSIDDIPETDFIEKENVRSIVNKIAFYERYCNDTVTEEIDL